MLITFMENTVIANIRRSRARLILLAGIVVFGMFLDGFDADLFFFGGTFILKIIHINGFLLGVAATGFAGGIAVFSFIGGYVFDKMSVKYGLITALILFSIFSALTGFVTNEYELVAFRFITGFGVGMVQPLIYTFMGDLIPSSRGRFLAMPAVLFGLGLFVAPYVFNMFSSRTTFDVPFIISGILGMILIILTFSVMPKYYMAKQRPRKGFYRYLKMDLMLAVLSMFAWGIGYFAYNSYYSSFLVSIGLSASQDTLVFSLFGIGLIISAIPGAFIGDKISRKYALLLAAFLYVLSTGLMFLTHMTYIEAIIATLIFGLGYGIYGVNISAIVQEFVEVSWTGSATGFLLGIFNIGALLGGPLFGTVLGLTHSYFKSGEITIFIPMMALMIMLIIMKSPDYKSIDAEDERMELGENA
ncbi:transporter [Picrophilus oshimae DSM 9789]|uniref:Transporter n=2 Tax=Picrophilus oshimae TaxID=46632 RepID=Q6L0Z6_PICTO|nr:transporter [Picrophilus oshimae DSM 9789]